MARAFIIGGYLVLGLAVAGLGVRDADFHWPATSYAATAAPPAEKGNAEKGAPAAEAAKASMTIADAWTNATARSVKDAPIYLRIINAGEGADDLIGIESEMAEASELHQTTSGREGGMRKVEKIAIPPGTVKFGPGADHAMLIGLRAPLRQGDSFIITVHFAKTSQQSTVVKILPANVNGVAVMQSAFANNVTGLDR